MKHKINLVTLGLCLIIYMNLHGCIYNHTSGSANTIFYQEEQPTPYELAMRFAPRLYINPMEPFQIKDLIVFVHPEKPLIAYHLIWEHDSIGVLLGLDSLYSDHECAWIEYDPVSLNLVNVWALWHRGILHTQASLIEARRNDQHPRFAVQWGQHGLLPFGWEELHTARPDVELRAHYTISKSIQISKYTNSKKVDEIKFRGNYSDYLAFNKLLDSRQYIHQNKVILSADCNKIITHVIDYPIMIKQPWPY